MKQKIFDFSVVGIDGREIALSRFEGKYLLMVNVASECGFTHQYKQLQELYEHYSGKLEIIGFPCNDFGGQEPAENQEIMTFCTKNYGVNFTMTSKINIKSEPQNEIYKWLCNKSENGVKDSTVRWNFQKYLISKDGVLIDVMDSNISPFDDRILSELESA